MPHVAAEDDGWGHPLINMRGRIYDPELGRFTTPDPFVQAPFFSQSLNRYAYAFNNPLRYTDPSGFKGIQGTKGAFGDKSNQPSGRVDIYSNGKLVSVEFFYPDKSAVGAEPTADTAATTPSSEKDNREPPGIEKADKKVDPTPPPKTGGSSKGENPVDVTPGGPGRGSYEADQAFHNGATDVHGPPGSAAPQRGGTSGSSGGGATGGGPQGPIGNEEKVRKLIDDYRARGAGDPRGPGYGAWDLVREDRRGDFSEPDLRDAEHYLFRYWLASEPGLHAIPYGLPMLPRKSWNPPVVMSDDIMRNIHDPLYNVIREILEKAAPVAPQEHMLEWEKKGYQEGFCASGDCERGARVDDAYTRAWSAPGLL